MENKNSRERQRLSRRQQILECAMDMIISRGYEAMRIRDIAVKLNISTGLFFNYFESKEQVFEELIRIGLSGPAGVIAMDTGDIEPIVLFEKMAAFIFDALKSDSITGKLFLLMTQAARTEAAPENVKRLLEGADFITPLLGKILQGQQQGQIKTGDPVALIMAYWGAVQGIASNYALSPGLPLPESSWVVDILRA